MKSKPNHFVLKRETEQALVPIKMSYLYIFFQLSRRLASMIENYTDVVLTHCQ